MSATSRLRSCVRGQGKGTKNSYVIARIVVVGEMQEKSARRGSQRAGKKA